MAPTDDDVVAVEALLGRPIRGGFEVVVRHDDGSPLVIRNAPLLDDGTPMPTRYWLVGEPERTWIGRRPSSPPPTTATARSATTPCPTRGRGPGPAAAWRARASA